MAFNPGLNRVTIGNFPGLPAGMAGSLAHEWLASWGMASRMQAELTGLDLPPVPPEVSRPQIVKRAVRRLPGWLLNRSGNLQSLLRESYLHLHQQRMEVVGKYPVLLSQLVANGDMEALAFADQSGVALAATLATLKVAPPESRVARTEWPATQWEHWKAMKRVVLGGGIMSGALGHHLHAVAREWLPKLGVSDMELHLFPNARELMLHGAARHYQNGLVVALDAGHTAIKRGWAEVDTRQIKQLHVAAHRPTPYHLKTQEDLLNFLTVCFLETIPDGRPVHQFALSLSAHCDEQGSLTPAAVQGSFYGPLYGLELAETLAERLSRAQHHACQVRVMHEGQAAVHGLPGMDTALLLGTSVGGNFKLPEPSVSG